MPTAIAIGCMGAGCELIDPRETRPTLCRWIDWIQPQLDELTSPTRFPMRP